LEAKVFGETKRDFAIGEESASRNIFTRVRDLKASGRTRRKSADFSEFTFYLMKRIPGSLPKDSRKPTRAESMQTPSSATATMSRTCLLTRSQRLTMSK
jgi:hypothetical protein